MDEPDVGALMGHHSANLDAPLRDAAQPDTLQLDLHQIRALLADGRE